MKKKPPAEEVPKTALSPQAQEFVPQRRPVQEEKPKPAPADRVEKKSMEELLAISSKSSLRLSAAAFVPAGYVQKSMPKIATHLPVSGPMTLRDSWNLYFIDRNLATEDNFDPILVFRMDSVEEFWRVFNNIPAASGMPQQSSYFLFRSDVNPKWEDERNRAGGRWVVRLKSAQSEILDGVWLRLCCRTIGESWGMEAHRDTVNGLVLKCRDRFHTLEIWVSEKHEAFPTDVLGAIQEMLPAYEIEYLEHSVKEGQGQPSSTKKKQSKRK